MGENQVTPSKAERQARALKHVVATLTARMNLLRLKRSGQEVKDQVASMLKSAYDDGQRSQHARPPARSPESVGDAILEIEAGEVSTRKGGDAGGRQEEGQLHSEGDRAERRGTPQESRRPEGPEDSEVPGARGSKAGRQDRETGESRVDPGATPLDQPAPSRGDQIVWPQARRMFERAQANQIIKGEQKYGTVLKTLNGRDAYQDFLQEQADGLMYATQLYLEAQQLVALLERSLQIVYDASMDSHSFIHARAGLAFIAEVQACLKQSGLSSAPVSDLSRSSP